MGRKALWFGGIFAAVGLIFAAIGGWFWWKDNQLASIGERAPGVVTGFETSYSSDNGTTYKPRVRFTDRNGEVRNFTSRIGSSPPSHSRGDEVEVIYDPADPQDAIIDSFTQRHLFPLAFGGFGLLFAGIGGGMVFSRIRRRRIIAGLQERGMRIEAEFLESFHDTSVKVNGRSPWRVACQAVHPATGKLQRFESDGMWIDPGGIIGENRVPVLLDPQRPKRSYVDLSQWVDESERG